MHGDEQAERCRWMEAGWKRRGGSVSLVPRKKQQRSGSLSRRHSTGWTSTSPRDLTWAPADRMPLSQTARDDGMDANIVAGLPLPRVTESSSKEMQIGAAPAQRAPSTRRSGRGRKQKGHLKLLCRALLMVARSRTGRLDP
ncbi:hypothetical protein BCR34DRAFT_583222 [Clohesyomyces aquaticus]|uniref:Uncharacterized protein n=1 Tax=Clohesyomyces aquaticus TaxID=1231657 RepID=A0A1Y2A6L0_9PLEO|nr:hypothetical protein BCR34DRAFT_583222 [Clohesyomyces aquaticus]